MSNKHLIEAENKAIQFLGSSEVKFDYQFLFNHLQPQFNWKNLNNDEEFRNYCLLNDTTSYKRSKRESILIRNYFKLIDPNYVLDQMHINESVGLDKIGLMALYCNEHQLDQKQFFNSLDSLSMLNDYEVTHALLSIYFLEKNQCFMGEEFNLLKKRVQSKNLELLNTKYYRELDDIAIESIALLQSTNGKIQTSWIKEILKNQKNDGGWSINSIESKSNTHTTILALWALSAYRIK